MTGSDNTRLPERYRTPDGRIDTARLRAETSIAAIAGEATELKRCGGELRGLCPLHPEDTASFFVNEGKGLYHCFGCSAGGDALDLFARLHDEDFVGACIALAGGTPRTGASAMTPEEHAVRRVLARQRAHDEWRRAVPVEGTVAERYLLGRALAASVPGSVRFSRVPRYWRDDGTEGPREPAMVAAAQDANGRVCGIQRTFLDREGRKSRFGEPRLALGRMRGAALRLGPERPEIMLAAATEDALALRLMFPGATVWSAFGDANLPFVELPRGVCRVTLCGDADAPGRNAVTMARDDLARRGIETDDLLPKGGAKDFAEEWVLLHA